MKKKKKPKAVSVILKVALILALAGILGYCGIIGMICAEEGKVAKELDGEMAW